MDKQTVEGQHEWVDCITEPDTVVFRWRDDRRYADSIEMARVDQPATTLTIIPRVLTSGALEAQFEQITTMTIDVAALSNWSARFAVSESEQGYLMLTGLPDGFGKSFSLGLGLLRAYRGIVHSVEKHTDCTVVRFSEATPEGPSGDVFTISPGRFARYRAAVDRNKSRARTVASRINRTEDHNAVADLLGVEPESPIMGRHPVVTAITRELTGGEVLNTSERRQVVHHAVKESRLVAAEAPHEFGELRRDIELVSLEMLIERFSDALNGRGHDEAYWQEFFANYEFALQQVFAAPLVVYRPQLKVKGENAFSQGARAVDFMLANSITRSAFIVEIKTPAAKLLGTTSYRGRSGSGAEVYLPGKDLVGAVAQLQAQIESARRDLDRLLADTPGAGDLDTYVVRGAVIVGTAGGFNAEERLSFERYRAGLANVEVLAFDEVLERIKSLHKMLAP